MNSSAKAVVFWLVILLAAMLLWQSVRSTPQDRQSREIPYSTFMSDVAAGTVANVAITGAEIRGQYRDGKGAFHLVGPANPAVYLDTLHDHGVVIVFRDRQTGSTPMQLLGTWAPLVLVGALWFVMIKGIRRGTPPQSGSGDPGQPIVPK